MASIVLHRTAFGRLAAGSPVAAFIGSPLSNVWLLRSRGRVNSPQATQSSLAGSRRTPGTYPFSFARPLTILSRPQDALDRQPSDKIILQSKRNFSESHQSQLRAGEGISPEAPQAPLVHEVDFEKSDRAAQAAYENLAARLSKDSKQHEQVDSDGIRRLVRFAKPERWQLTIACTLLVLFSGVSMLIPWSIGKVMDAIKDSEPGNIRLFDLTLHEFVLALALVLTAGSVANFGAMAMLRIIGERVVARLRSQLYRRTYTQDAEFFDANRVGDLLSRLNSDTIVVGKSITQNMSRGLSSLVTVVSAAGIMVYTSPFLTGLMLLLFPPAAIGTSIYGRLVRNTSKSIQKNLGVLAKIAEERLGNIRTCQSFVGEVQEVRRYNEQVRTLFAVGRQQSFVHATYDSTTIWAGDMASCALLVIGGSLVSSGALSVGDLTSFLLYAAWAGSGLFGLSEFYAELMKGLGAATRLFELQDRRPDIYQTSGKRVKSAQGHIRFDNVSFAYPTRPSVRIFDGVTFEIPAGSNVCVVGPSGSGKSTVASLLLRFYKPGSGTITIDGVNTTEMNAKTLRRRIAVVSQEPVLFSGSLAENIAYGKPTATRAEIVTAAKKANCNFIGDLPEGLDTQVGVRGSQLSGGQKQRIAIARALLKDPDILILDEATSALDAESEMLVNEAMATLLNGSNTTISIAHRLSTIQQSDSIIVLDNKGRVAETGSYTQLVADKQSAFMKLMERQLGEAEELDSKASG